MDSYPFAHTAPLWIGRPGSTDPAAARRAAAALLAALDVAEERVRSAYKQVRASQVLDRIALARDRLQMMVR
jgi:TolB protein